MRCPKRLKRSRPREDGFTLIDAISAIAVFSALSLALWIGIAAAYRGSESTSKASGNAVGVLTLQAVLESAASRVRPPFWVSSLAARLDGDTLRVPYLDGDVDADLEVRVADGSLRVSTGGASAG